MGIGLYHCKTIIDAHGGKLNVESEEGKGTVFKILLPRGKNNE
jgi:signal transduction histidine kinase